MLDPQTTRPGDGELARPAVCVRGGGLASPSLQNYCRHVRAEHRRTAGAR
jgi:hypothetical protein